jgi:DNA polymerase-3 subunit delta
MPFLGTGKLLIVKNAGNFSASQWESFTRYLEHPNPSTTLVFVIEKVDKRLGFFKTLKKFSREVECKPPADSELPGWASRMAKDAGLNLDPRVAQSLVMRVGNDLQLLWREILKLHAFAGDKRLTVEDVEQLVGEARGTTVFALTDAVGVKDLKGTMTALRKLLELGEPPVLLLYMLARNFRLLAKARQLKDEGGNLSPGALAAKMGAAPFVARKAMEQAANWPKEKIEKAFRALLLADVELKSGGGEEVVEKLVIDLCAKERRREAPVSARR